MWSFISFIKDVWQPFTATLRQIGEILRRLGYIGDAMLYIADVLDRAMLYIADVLDRAMLNIADVLDRGGGPLQAGA